MSAQQPKSILDAVQTHVRSRGDAEALSFYSSEHSRWCTWTWSQLWQQVEATATNMRSQGVSSDDRIGVWLENGCPWILTDLALQLMQCVSVPIHPATLPRQASVHLSRAACELLIVNNPAQSDETGLQLSCRTLPVADVLIGNGQKPKQYTPAEPDMTAVQTILFTSGTTGVSKGVELTYGNLYSNAVAALERYDFKQDELVLNLLPLSHVFARTCDLYVWCLNGHHMVCSRGKESFSEDIKHWRPTHINAVPVVFQNLLSIVTDKCSSLSDVTGGRLRHVNAGGALVPEPLRSAFQSNGIPMYQGYGLSETSPVIALEGASGTCPESVGRPLNSVEVRIKNGEIQTRGPSVMKGYLDDPERTAAVFDGSWLKTGDLGRIDEDGFLYVDGRLDEMMVTAAGHNINPALLESQICQEPDVARVVVFGHGKPYLVGLIVLNSKCVESHDLLNRINNHLLAFPKYCRIHEIVVLDRDLSIEDGELTSKQSLVRNVIAQSYASEIESMYI
jgi:long-chain acyl-CoA synthetase